MTGWIVGALLVGFAAFIIIRGTVNFAKGRSKCSGCGGSCAGCSGCAQGKRAGQSVSK